MMTAPEIKEACDVQYWSNWTPFALERLPLPYPLLIALVGVITFAEQVLEYSFDDPTFGYLTARTVTRLLVLPVLAVYILIFLRAIRGWAIRALVQLRPTVLISDEEYSDYTRRMLHADWRVDLVLLAASLAVVVGLFVLARWGLLSTTSTLPTAWPTAAFIVAVYVLFGWLLLSQVAYTIRHAYALSVLAQCPLDVNVFNQDNLLPFGRLSLLHTLPSIGVILIPLLILGPPAEAGYVVIPLSLAGLLNFFVPLWRVHQQIGLAKEKVLASMYPQCVSIQDALLQGTGKELEDLGKLNDRINKLDQLRKTIAETPEWPFRNSAAFGRSIVVILTPLLSLVGNEMVRAYVLPILKNLGGG